MRYTHCRTKTFRIEPDEIFMQRTKFYLISAKCRNCRTINGQDNCAISDRLFDMAELFLNN